LILKLYLKFLFAMPLLKQGKLVQSQMQAISLSSLMEYNHGDYSKYKRDFNEGAEKSKCIG